MKILLLGEYSRLHNSLKEGLVALGHDVSIAATGDNFKKYNVDHTFNAAYFNKYWLLRKIKNSIYLLFKFDIQKLEKGFRFYFLLKKLKKFDHIQLINSDAIETFPKLGRWLLRRLFKNNSSATKSLLVCGDETPVIDFLLKRELDYSILTPYFEDQSLQSKFDYSLKYTKKNYRKLFEWVYQHTTSLIVSDIDYKIPMERMGYKAHFIPNPINASEIEFKENKIEEKIVIFLGINRMNYIKKGIRFFEEALAMVKQKYPDKITVIISEDVPYSQYIKSYDSAHILLDMVYAFDQGYNALEAMAKGKVVFTGASPDFENEFNLTAKVAFDAVPDAGKIASDLSFLIENPDEITAIGKRARLFIEREHDSIAIAKAYLKAWEDGTRHT